MAVKLTEGAVARLSAGRWDKPEVQPVLKVVDIRPVQTQDPPRYRLLLSDGLANQQGMLATQRNDLVRSQKLQKGSIIRLTDFVCNLIRDRIIIILIDFDVLVEKCDVIGDSKPFILCPPKDPLTAAPVQFQAFNQPATSIGSDVPYVRVHRPSSHFNKAEWGNIEKNTKERTTRCFDKKQLKNKSDNMNKERKLFDRSMRLETGIGWDPVKKTFQAPAEWWDEKIKGNKDYAKFRDESCYAPLFRDSDVVGDRTKAPSDCQNNNDPTNEKYNEGKGDSDEIDLGEDDEPLFLASSSSKRKKSNTITHTRSTKGKSSGSLPLEDKLDDVIEAISARNTQSFPPKDSSPTTQECMAIVTCFPGFEEGSRKYCRALRIFLKKQIRENFMVPKNHAARMEFLKLMMEEENHV